MGAFEAAKLTVKAGKKGYASAIGKMVSETTPARGAGFRPLSAEKFNQFAGPESIAKRQERLGDGFASSARKGRNGLGARLNERKRMKATASGNIPGNLSGDATVDAISKKEKAQAALIGQAGSNRWPRGPNAHPGIAKLGAPPQSARQTSFGSGGGGKAVASNGTPAASGGFFGGIKDYMGSAAGKVIMSNAMAGGISGGAVGAINPAGNDGFLAGGLKGAAIGGLAGGAAGAAAGGRAMRKGPFALTGSRASVTVGGNRYGTKVGVLAGIGGGVVGGSGKGRKRSTTVNANNWTHGTHPMYFNGGGY